ncbi:MAG: hypothetical protein ACKVX7_03725 [Planctomycetota bacterium]
MKRFGFFVALFSVGLVLFLILTGQMAKLFRDSTRGGTGADEWSRATDKSNVFSYFKSDAARGRIRFELKGELDESTQASIENPSINQISLRNATLLMPLYQGDSTTSYGNYEITATKVRWDSKRQLVSMEDGIVGKGADSEFDTARLEFSMREGEDSATHLTSESPIRLVYPTFELFGERGFRGTGDEKTPLRQLTIHPPVTMAIARTAGRDLLGVTTGSVSDAGERIYLVSDGPLELSETADRLVSARLTGKVVIFAAPTGVPLHPRPAVPPQHFVCDYFELRLDASSKQDDLAAKQEVRATHAMAKGIHDPVEAFFLAPDQDPSDPYRIRGRRIEWVGSANDAPAHALFTGEDAVAVIGPLGKVESKQVRFYPGEKRCVLEQDLRVLLDTKRLKNYDSNVGKRSLSQHLSITAERGEFNYGRASAGNSTPFFVATATQPCGVEISEPAVDGLRIFGSKLEFLEEQQTVAVGSSGLGAKDKPYFADNRSRVAADRIVLDLERQELRFEGAVEGQIYTLSLNGQAASDAPSDDGYWQVECDALVLSWSGNGALTRREISKIHALGTTRPMRIDRIDERSFRVTGNAATWYGAEQRVLVEGATGEAQHLYFLSKDQQSHSVHIRAELLALDLDKWLAKASRDVAVESNRTMLFGRSDSSIAGAAPPLTIRCAELEVELQRPTKTSTNESRNEPAAHSIIQKVRAWADAGQSIHGTDGSYEISGQELSIDPERGVVLMKGGERQRLRFRDELDTWQEVSARVISVTRVGENEANVELTGDVEASLVQRSVVDIAAPRAPKSDAPLVWELRLGELKAKLESVNVTPRGDGRTRAIELVEMFGRDGVNVTCAAKQLVMQGSACDWDQSSQRLRIYAPGGASGVQSLRQGPIDAPHEIVAREITAVRTSAADRDEVLLFFEDVLSATFYLRGELTTKDDAAMPAKFELSSRNLLVFLDTLRGPVAESTLREANAWSDVNFKARASSNNKVEVIAEAAVFRSADSTVTFSGRPDLPPNVLIGGANLKPSDPVVLRKNSRSEFEVSLPSRGQAVTTGQFRKALEYLGKKDRAPSP